MRRTKFIVEDVNKAIGQRVCAFRRSMGLTQKELGEHIGVSHQQVQKYEKGKDRLSISQLIHVSKVLSVDMSDLLPLESRKDKSLLSSLDDESIRLLKAFSSIEDRASRANIIRIVQSFNVRG